MTLVWKQTGLCPSSRRLLTTGTQYNDIIKEAQRADLIVEAKMNNWSKAIAMLSKPVSEIQQNLPVLLIDDISLELIESTIKKIRENMQMLEELSNVGAGLLVKMDKHTETDDILPLLLKSFHDKTKNESSAIVLRAEDFKTEVEQQLSIYIAFDKEFAELNTEQLEVGNTIKKLFTQLTDCTAKNETLIKRTEAIGNLLSAFDKFKEIRINLVEGIKVMYTVMLQVKTAMRELEVYRRFYSSTPIIQTS
ncbi:hypothetical protein BDF20DRAFT_345997 [Mycotypha africana]|uniref:uncharacterized protein n=1 Tax=Mycotypha africana TaxID=64632 RepID=UPI002301DE4D|nr:uncharacterized protein BDF20DRAFT_345997 [Mycotypha africana]KAI8967000.1 hypothetical protein BDF20DRAFT_345997 [Mycotypha africana]